MLTDLYVAVGAYHTKTEADYDMITLRLAGVDAIVAEMSPWYFDRFALRVPINDMDWAFDVLGKPNFYKGRKV